MKATYDELDNGKVVIHYEINGQPFFRLLWPEDAQKFLALEDKQAYYDTLSS